MLVIANGRTRVRRGGFACYWIGRNFGSKRTLTGLVTEAKTIGHNIEGAIADLEKKMRAAAANLEFEDAARFRDELKRLRNVQMNVMEG